MNEFRFLPSIGKTDWRTWPDFLLSIIFVAKWGAEGFTGGADVGQAPFFPGLAKFLSLPPELCRSWLFCIAWFQNLRCQAFSLILAAKKCHFWLRIWQKLADVQLSKLAFCCPRCIAETSNGFFVRSICGGLPLPWGRRWSILRFFPPKPHQQKQENTFTFIKWIFEMPGFLASMWSFWCEAVWPLCCPKTCGIFRC